MMFLFFHNATYIDVQELYDYYATKHNYTGKAKKFSVEHGAMFKMLMPIYLKREIWCGKNLYF